MSTFEQLLSTFYDQDAVGIAVSLLILGMFVTGVINVAISGRRLRREHQLIKGASDKLLSGARCPKGPVEAVLDFLAVPLASLLGRRIARVLRLRTAGMGHREVLQQVTAERLEGYGALARYIGVTLTLLGLLGTVFGMSLALANIPAAMGMANDVNALRELTQALGGTLSGMKTAFGCTMAGILTAIILSGFNHKVRRLQSVVMAELEEFIICELLPALESVDPGADETAKAFANALAKAATELDQLRGTITAAAAGYHQASQQLTGAVTTMQTAVQSFGEHVTRSADNQQTFTQTMGETRDAVRAMTELLTRQFSDLREFTVSSNKLLESRLATIEESSKTNLTLQESLRTLAEKFQPAITGYHDHFKEWVGKVFEDFKGSLNQTLTEVNRQYTTGIAGQLDHHQKTMVELLRQQAESWQSLAKENQSGMAQVVEGQSKALLDFSQQHHHKMSELIGQQKTTLGDFSNLVNDVNLNLGALFDRLPAAGNDRPRSLSAATTGGHQ